jgi:hypothetical protein
VKAGRLTLATCLLAGFAEPISSTLKMEAICSSETSVEIQRTTRGHIPEDDYLICGLIEVLSRKSYVEGSETVQKHDKPQ